MVSKVGLYAYGVVGESLKQLNILGIYKENKVFPVEGRNLTVLVSKIEVGKFQCQIKEGLSELAKAKDSFPRRVEELLRTHEGVVDALGKLTTVVPFKFGTVLKDEEAALKMLQDYEEKFKKLLSKFTGKEEWGLKVYADNQEFKKHLAKVGSGGTAYLLGRKREEELKNDVSARLAKASEVIFQEAGKDAYEAKLNKTLPQKLTGKEKEMILNTAFLIEREKVTIFCKQVKKLIEKYEPMGIEIEVSGPWPPYSFT